MLFRRLPQTSSLSLPFTVTVPFLFGCFSCLWLPLCLARYHPSFFNAFSILLTLITFFIEHCFSFQRHKDSKITIIYKIKAANNNHITIIYNIEQFRVQIQTKQTKPRYSPCQPPPSPTFSSFSQPVRTDAHCVCKSAQPVCRDAAQECRSPCLPGKKTAHTTGKHSHAVHAAHFTSRQGVCARRVISFSPQPGSRIRHRSLYRCGMPLPLRQCRASRRQSRMPKCRTRQNTPC